MFFQKLEHFFLGKLASDDVDLFDHARVTFFACLITSAFAVLYTFVSFAINFIPGVIVMSLDALALIAIIFLMRHSKATILLANLYTLLCWLPITILVFFSGGMYSTILPWIAIVPITANLIVNRKYALVWLGVTLVTIVGFSLLQSSNIGMSHHYNLTQLFNRNKINEVFNYEIIQIGRHNKDLSLIIMDIDNFKQVNDTFGHLVGDKMLIEISNILKDSVRTSDTVGRWGGEEFIIIAPNTDNDGVFVLAEKIRINIEGFSFTGADKTTCSFGVTTYAVDDTELDMIKKADQALYNSKEIGKNTVSRL